MRTLAIDTSAGTSIAVLDGATVLAEINHAENMTHAERIGSTIAEVLSMANLLSSQIERVVVGVGPGPFTGLRVGIAAAKFFAVGVGAELVSVCSLDSIAYQYYQSGGEGSLLIETDARRKEHFWATYTGFSDGVPLRVVGPKVNKPEDIKSAGFQTTEFLVSAGALGQLAFAQGRKVSHDLTPLYLREPDATPSKGKKVSG